MKIVRAMLLSVLGTFGGSIAGGFAGGAAIALVGNFPDLSRAISFSAGLSGLGIYFLGITTMALLGAVGGPIVGLIPTFILGTALWMLSVFRPFRYLMTWAAVGTIVGLALNLWLDFRPTLPLSERQSFAWTVAWAVGGAVSMSVYWLAAIEAGRTNKVR